MEFIDMTKDELEAYGRTVGIELDRRLTKSVLIDQLNDHIENAEAELSDELSDPVYLDAEIEEEDFPVTGEDHPLMPAIEEEPVDPTIAIQAEKDARRLLESVRDKLRQVEEKCELLKKNRMSVEALEKEALEELASTKEYFNSVEQSWEKSKELL